MRIVRLRADTLRPDLFSSVQISARSSSSDSGSPRAVTSETLLADSKELVIKHAGRDYHLRLTKQGELILTPTCLRTIRVRNIMARARSRVQKHQAKKWEKPTMIR